MNTLFTAFWYNHQVKLTRPPVGPPQETVLYGPLCMNIDVVRDKCLLPNLHRGEQVVIHPVGAYNVTQSMQFIEMKPAVVLVSPKGEVKLIKRRETMEDMVAMES